MAKNKYFLSLAGWKPDLISEVIEKAVEVKAKPESYSMSLKGKTLAMLFMKSSTRTRVSFEVGMTQLGGHAIYLDWHTTNFTLGEIKDETKSLERYLDLIMARVHKHSELLEIAESSHIPVINGLSDLFHPCQALADIQTIKEKKGKLDGLKLAFIGDGNNVCNSLIIGCCKMGLCVSVATPKGYKPHASAVKLGKELGSLRLFNKPEEAVKDADVVYTDTWISMGQESEKEHRMKAFAHFQVNKKLMDFAKKDAIFMHCLPVHRGFEVTSNVLDSEQSVVFDQAENRLHAQKALMLKLMRKF